MFVNDDSDWFDLKTVDKERGIELRFHLDGKQPDYIDQFKLTWHGSVIRFNARRDTEFLSMDMDSYKACYDLTWTVSAVSLSEAGGKRESEIKAVIEEAMCVYGMGYDDTEVNNKAKIIFIDNAFFQPLIWHARKGFVFDGSRNLYPRVIDYDRRIVLKTAKFHRRFIEDYRLFYTLYWHGKRIKILAWDEYMSSEKEPRFPVSVRAVRLPDGFPETKETIIDVIRKSMAIVARTYDGDPSLENDVPIYDDVFDYPRNATFWER